MDNIFIERLWRSLKYEEVYLKGYVDAAEARSADRQLDQLLQSQTPTSGAARPGADDYLAKRGDRPIAGPGYGHGAALGRRQRVAHMPTAATASSGMIFLEVRAAPVPT
jgi:hypothetical protein